MALKHAYESKLNKLTLVDKIISELQLNFVGTPTHFLNNEVIYVTEKDKVSPFIYPIYDVKTDRVFIDTRTFTSLDRAGSLQVKNITDMNINTLLANLELIWNRSQKRDVVFNSFDYSNQVFVNWLTNLIAKRTGADILTKAKLFVVTAMYLVGQYYNDVTSMAAAKEHIRYILNTYPVDHQTLDITINTLDYTFPRDIDEYCEAIKRLDLGPRFKDFNSAIFYQILGAEWYNTSNSKYLVATALEYPPAFAALVMTAVENRFFKNTGIGKVVELRNRNNSHENFKRSMTRLIDNHTDYRG